MAELKRITVEKVHRKVSDNIPTFYINNVEIRSTQWDLRLALGQIAEVRDGTVEVVDQVHIYLSPQHAKVLARTLSEQVQAYEENVGPLPQAEVASPE
ncbi:MAG TPA: DUF3467 domain-containing protein [Gammaproteobacteria bacterium]|nr:DUF3467 domain-containing protein [Gammaproteobacteria bacterium]